MLFELQIPNGAGDSTYRQHQYVDAVLWNTRPQQEWRPRDYLWSEHDGVLFIRRSLPTNDLAWRPVDVPPPQSMITLQLQARCRHSSQGEQRQSGAATKRGARAALTEPTDNLAWLDRTARRIGLDIEDADVDLVCKAIVKRGRESRTRFDLVLANFVAVATVEDAARFEEALGSGVGDSKAFGCGYIHFWQRGG